MNRERDDFDFEIEAERYELREPGVGPFRLGRREFLGTVGAGLFVVCLLRPGEAEQDPRRRQGRGRGGDAPREIGAWLRIDAKGKVTAYSGKAEVGQNARTSLAQAVADELRLPAEKVTMVLGDTARVPYDAGTFGSRTTPAMAPQLRRAGAAARELLIDLTAEHLEVDRDELTVEDGRVVHAKSGRSVPFGELAGGRKLVETIEEDASPTPPAQWEAAGKSAPKADGRAFVTGRHQYASDIKREGMLVGKVLRPPAYGAKLRSADLAGARALPGVTVVREGDFVGVAAPDEPTAAKALAAIKAEWSLPDGDGADDRTLYDAFAARLDEARAQPDEKAEAVARALEAAEVKAEATYTAAYIAHAPLEPRAAVAEWGEDGGLTVWTGTQRPFGVRGDLAGSFGMPEDRVRVIVPDTGAGYGGKHTIDAATEAARLSRAAGKPMRVVWTREEEFTWAYFRPAGLMVGKAGATRDGRLTAWEFHNVNSGGSGLATPYAVGAKREAFHPADSPLRQGSYRALASTANHFARESLMDELAAAIGMDPLEFRLKNLRDDRLRAVLEAAAERFGWGRSGPGPGHGFGLACGTEKGGFVATCAEVAIEGPRRQVRVVRAVTAFECGAIVNPEHLEAQVSGSVVQGLGGALFEAIKFGDGVIRNPRFARYRLPRFRDVPTMEVVLLDRRDLPSAGGGEAPIVAIAPAIGNAVFRATGERPRSLPMAPEGLGAKGEEAGGGS